MRVLAIPFALLGALPFAATAGAQCPLDVVHPANPTADEGFGTALDLAGDVMVVGAPQHEDVVAGTIGAAFVLERQASTWTEIAQLSASDADHQANFGLAVGTDGVRVAVGAPDADSIDTRAGEAYVFEAQGGAWTEVAALVASDGGLNDRFGSAVAIEGDLVVVGAENAGTAGASPGAAYVFERSGGAWTEVQKLTGHPIGSNDFGQTLALNGDRLLVGAPGQSTTGLGAGAVYAYERLGGVWIHAATLEPSLLLGGDSFGAELALEGDRAFVAAPYSDLAGPDAGTIFVYETTTWTLVAMIQAPPAEDPGTPERLGWRFEVEGTRLAALAVDGSAFDAPEVHVFHVSPGGAKHVGKGGLALTGNDLALDGDRLWLGTPKESTLAHDAGALHELLLTGLVERFGAGSTSLLGGYQPELFASGCLAPGGAMEVDVRNAFPGLAGLLIVGTAPLAVPYGSGTIYVAPPLVGQIAHVLGGPVGAFGQGATAFVLPLIANPGLVGLDVYLQAGYADLLSPDGVALTNGVHVRFGPDA